MEGDGWVLRALMFEGLEHDHLPTLMPFGPGIEVLGPQELRRERADAVRRLADSYLVPAP